MARPRVFISSTFYDLKHVRGELEKFIKDLGYEPVLNERGHIPYGSSEELENYCYAEIEKINIVISIIGGRFGSSSRGNEKYSISNMELKTALKQNKQVYIFIESGIHSEYQTYLKNKGNNIVYSHVDDKKIYSFIEEVYSLPNNNQIASFDNVYFITSYLKEQWAGLFESYLEYQERAQMAKGIEKIQEIADTLGDVVKLLTTQKDQYNDSGKKNKEAIDSIIIQNHPIFSILKDLLYIKYRVFFSNLKEMEDWLSGSRSGDLINEHEWDDPKVREYFVNVKNKKNILYVNSSIFDKNGNLIPILPRDWDDSLISLREFVFAAESGEAAP